MGRLWGVAWTMPCNYWNDISHWLLPTTTMLIISFHFTKCCAETYPYQEVPLCIIVWHHHPPKVDIWTVHARSCYMQIKAQVCCHSTTKNPWMKLGTWTTSQLWHTTSETASQRTTLKPGHQTTKSLKNRHTKGQTWTIFCGNSSARWR